jgi:hypothetical protein
VGVAPGLRSQSYFGGVGSSHDIVAARCRSHSIVKKRLHWKSSAVSHFCTGTSAKGSRESEMRHESISMIPRPL